MARGHADDYVLNYLAIDSALHQPVQRTGIPHREQVRTLLDDLTRTIDDVARALGIADRVQIFAIADHGSTRIPADAPNVTDEKYFKKMALDASHRFVVATDEQLANL